MKVKNNWEFMFWITFLVITIVFLMGGVLWLFGNILYEFKTYLGWILVILIMIFIGILLNLLDARSRGTPKFSNTPVEGSRSIKVSYGNGKTSTIFTYVQQTLFGDSSEDIPEEIYSVMLPNGRFIGSDRLKSAIFHMGLTGNTTRARWVGRGDMNLSKNEWKGVILFLDRWNLLEKLDGNKNAHMRKIDLKTWWNEVKNIVDESK